MKEKRYYIAYGSNLNVPQMQMRCPHATILGTAALKGWELLFKGSKTGSYLTIEECESGTVPVVIWEVTAADEAALDRYEGFPNFYYKKDINLQYKGIRTGKRRTVTAFAYIPLTCPARGHTQPLPCRSVWRVSARPNPNISAPCR